MTDFKFSCPHCGKKLSVNTSIIGRKGTCKYCSGVVIVPKPKADSETIENTSQETISICPYCRTIIKGSEKVQICASCKTPHHQDCWLENNGCTVYGCKNAPPDEEKVTIHIPNTSLGIRPSKNAPGAVASLVWGIIGFFLCGLIGGIISISEASKAKKLIRDQPEKYTGEGLATAGLVIGIIDLVGWGIVLLSRLASVGK